MTFTTGNLNDPLVFQRPQNLRGVDLNRTSVARNAKSAGTHAENITIAGQVDLVLFAAADLGDLAHDLMLLCP